MINILFHQVQCEHAVPAKAAGDGANDLSRRLAVSRQPCSKQSEEIAFSACRRFCLLFEPSKSKRGVWGRVDPKIM